MTDDRNPARNLPSLVHAAHNLAKSSCDDQRSAQTFQHARSRIDRKCDSGAVQLFYSRLGTIAAGTIAHGDRSVLSRGRDVVCPARMVDPSLVNPRRGIVQTAELVRGSGQSILNHRFESDSVAAVYDRRTFRETVSSDGHRPTLEKS